MNFENLPRTWRDVNISITDKKLIADSTEEYTINFAYKNMHNSSTFNIPKVNGNRFILNGFNYVVWYRLCKPICSIEYTNNIHTLYINSILTRPDRPENYNMAFYLLDNNLKCRYQDIEYDISDPYLHDLLFSYWITNQDRISLNEFINSDNNYNYISKQDIDNIEVILKENSDYITDWRDVFSLKVINLEDLIISTIMLALPSVLKIFFSKGTINTRILTKNIRTFLVTEAPEIRLDMNETSIASYAQNNKIILPFDNYCDVNDIIPDKSWYQYFDLLDAPQSIKVGSVASLDSSVVIKDGKLTLKMENSDALVDI